MKLPSTMTLSEVQTAMDELLAFGTSGGRALLLERTRRTIARLREEQTALAVHTPEGQARFYEIRGELAQLNQQLAADFGLTESKALELAGIQLQQEERRA